MLQNLNRLVKRNASILKGRNASKFDHLMKRNASILKGRNASKFEPLDEAKCFNTEPLDEAKCSNYSGLKTASPRGAKAGGVCWMVRCSGGVGDRKGS
jgi:hypothetical protein